MQKLSLLISLVFVGGGLALQANAGGSMTTNKTATTGMTGAPVTMPAGNNTPNNGKLGPCEQIQADCRSHGYVVGEAKIGKGMWWDCLCPLIGQNFPEPSANVLAVPSDSGLVAACRQHPHGQRIIQNCANMMAKKNAKQAGQSH